MDLTAFDLEEFIDSPSVACLQSCRMADLILIAQHYGGAVRKQPGKLEVREAVLAGLVELGVLVPLEVLAKEKQDPGDVAAPAPVEGQVEDTVVSPAGEEDGEDGEKGATLKTTLGSLALPPFPPYSFGAESTSSATPGSLSAAGLRLRLARLQMESYRKMILINDERGEQEKETCLEERSKLIEE
ncbi:hypothetical protein NHX12_008696 [Muraenolepis orangiensis]|uniref:Uncharacterized protein n=1 Tax=Muraenolepis orangiensis TaxID=630683 RepID=A0A9Q0DQE3_9TELE|nr:hypothetical protein NHX12_008696 [Muraenolepis orangiensis]